MTQRTIFAGAAPTVIIKAGTSVTVEGWDYEHVHAETDSRGGLKVEARSENEIGRARAAVGDRVLFDVRLKLPDAPGKETSGEAIEVQVGGDGRVWVPLGSRVKVYAGTNAQVSGIQGSVGVVAGGNVHVRSVGSIAHATSGGAIDLECEAMDGDEVKLEAGRDLRCYIRGLTDAKVLIKDLGGYWEGTIGDGEVTLRLKAGGDVTLVTDQEVKAEPPDYMVGQIERPGEN